MKFGLSDTVISELQAVFRRHANIEKVLIFGSRSKGNYREGSDIDLAALGKGLDYNQLLQILTEIDDLELLYSVDCLTITRLSTPLSATILTAWGRCFISRRNFSGNVAKNGW